MKMDTMKKQTDRDAGGNSISAAKILVIDDEEILLKSCRRALEPSGYDVEIGRAHV